jgi:hypothetical protein
MLTKGRVFDDISGDVRIVDEELAQLRAATGSAPVGAQVRPRLCRTDPLSPTTLFG